MIHDMKPKHTKKNVSVSHISETFITRVSSLCKLGLAWSLDVISMFQWIVFFFDKKKSGLLLHNKPLKTVNIVEMTESFECKNETIYLGRTYIYGALGQLFPLC